MEHWHSSNPILPEFNHSDVRYLFFGMTLGTIAAVVGAAAAVGTGVTMGVQAESAHDTQTEAARAQEEALAAQGREKATLEKLASEAPEKERQAELEKRRKRVKTLLTSMDDETQATVGTKTLLGG